MREALTGRKEGPAVPGEPAYKVRWREVLGEEREALKAHQVRQAARARKAAAAKPGTGAPAGPAPAAEAGATTRGTVHLRPVHAAPTEFMRHKIRDRYLAARFPGASHADADLAATTEVIKSARLLFEDGDAERACEWLAFASDVNPDEALWLAQLEILFLRRDGEEFTALARAYRERFPGSPNWDEVARLGARLTTGEPTFAGSKPPADSRDEHYGPWPRVLNWIQAPFDLTGDVLGAEFHAKMRDGAELPPITAKAS